METALPAPTTTKQPATGRYVAGSLVGVLALLVIAAGVAGLVARYATSEHGWITSGPVLLEHPRADICPTTRILAPRRRSMVLGALQHVRRADVVRELTSEKQHGFPADVPARKIRVARGQS